MKTGYIKITALFVMLSTAVLSQAQSNFSSNLIGVGVVVKDINKSLDFYINAIGMVKTGTIDLDEDFAGRSGLSNGVPFHIDVLKLENSPGANEWKLMSFKKDPSHPKQQHIQNDNGMQYITINVKSLQPILERLMERNVPFLGKTPTKLDDKRHFVLVQDPDGNFVELIGPLDNK